MVNVASDRRYRGIRCCFTLLILTVAAAGSAVAQADTLSLGTGISATWNRDTQPLSSPVIQLLVSNSDNDLNAILYGVTLGLSFQPVGGATGSLQVASVVDASTNPVFTAGIDTPTINPFPNDGYTSIGILNSQENNVAVPQSLAGLIGLTLSSSNAVGTFDIVVQPFSDGLSSWNNFDFDEFAFANADTAALTIGQITVTAVPEPSGIALVATACLAGLAGVSRLRGVRGRGNARRGNN
jgi:hypothetical protein